jgi:lipid-binding SYLF domain-containing protein
MEVTMIRTLQALSALSALVLVGCQTGQPLDTSSPDKVQALASSCESALNSFFTQVQQGKEIVDQSQGTLVFPDLTKAGFIVGAETGNGCLFEDGKVTSYYNKSGGSFGFQAGAQSTTQVIVMTSQEAMRKLQSAAGLDFGGNASATVVDTGIGATVNTATLMNNEIIAFVLDEKGLMAGATLEGTKITKLDWQTSS